MNNQTSNRTTVWQFSNPTIIVSGVLLLVLVYAFSEGLMKMEHMWSTKEEYGYGYMIPILTLFFIWQQKNRIEQMEFTGSYLGVFAVIMGGMFLILGELATLFIVVQYAFLVTLMGLVLSFTGWKVFRVMLPALVLLLFMIPLPNFLYNSLSAELQLISSKIGVAIIRLFDISVFLEGNVIDLGVYKLQVVEACSGLRYLFPFAALAYISAYIYKGELWKKVIIFLSSAPITVVMNSVRIGIIGVLVEYYGIEQAEGFLHDFEGWIVFMACMGILIFEMWVLSRIGNKKLSLTRAFELEFPEELEGERKQRPLPATLKMTLPIILVITLLPVLMESRDEIIPERQQFVSFPDELSGWSGARKPIESEVIDVLQFSDYLMTDYQGTVDDKNAVINLYIAYYNSQKKGASIHSPRSCIPGGGWVISKHTTESVTLADGASINVNRLLIQKDSYKQLVYYWFDQRGRSLTNEYEVKWYLFWDALTKNRTDGALVRATTVLGPGESIEEADAKLVSFLSDFNAEIGNYLPD